MKKFCLFLPVISVLLWLFGLLAFNNYINGFVVDTEQKTDAIVVLTGGRNRLREAVRLLNAGMAEKMLISGVYSAVSLRELQKRPDVQIAAEKKVILDKKSTNTVENAIESARWIKANGITSVRLVTSNYHLPRSAEEFRFYAPELKIVMHPVYSDKVARHFWQSRHSFRLMAMEYNKFLYVWLKNRLTARGD